MKMTKYRVMAILLAIAISGSMAQGAMAATDSASDTSSVSTDYNGRKLSNYTKFEIKLLTCIIFCEAGNQSYEGKLAVANVVLNRVESNAFSHADTIKEVIYDLKYGRQFTPAYTKTASGSYTTVGAPMAEARALYSYHNYESTAQRNQMKECYKAAKAAMSGENNIGNYLYFNSLIEKTKLRLTSNSTKYTILGDHIFY